ESTIQNNEEYTREMKMRVQQGWCRRRRGTLCSASSGVMQNCVVGIALVVLMTSQQSWVFFFNIIFWHLTLGKEREKDTQQRAMVTCSPTELQIPVDFWRARC
uniref:Uncharacterized protein n=1 Tax=Pundamilia nyererei TaxID=303518 RepID=A0A3B4G0P2_9CICH